MSAAAPLLAALGVTSAATASGTASLSAGAETGTTPAGPDASFQLLIAALGLQTQATCGAAPLLPGTAPPADGTVPREHDQGSESDGDEDLLEALAALCAWQAPPATVTAAATPVVAAADADAGGAAGEPAAALSISATGAAAIDSDGTQSGTDPQQPLQRAAGGTEAARSHADAAAIAVAKPETGNVTTPLPDAAATDALRVATAAALTPERLKPAPAARESATSAVDALANGGLLLRSPVISSTVTRSVAVPVHDPRWPEAVATQIRWAVSDGVQSATLKLVPEHLGPLELHIELKDNQVNVNFGANQADTRQALQDSLPRLRDALAGAGITLGQASVQQQSGRASQSAAGGSRAAREDAVEPVALRARVALGLIDEYA